MAATWGLPRPEPRHYFMAFSDYPRSYPGGLFGGGDVMVETLLRKLEGVRPLGGRRWKACCPAHEDSDPSLAIREADDGRLLVHCFAGCSPGDVMAALGLSLADLYPTPLGQALEPLWRDPAYLGLERTVLAVAEADHRAKRRLSRADLERELAAYRKVREWQT